MARIPKSAKDRLALREELFPGLEERIWPDKDGSGWFKAPRTLPIVLMLLDQMKDVRRDVDVTRTYLGLLSHNRDDGVVVIGDESEFASLSGFKGSRAVRSWRERMAKLAAVGLIVSRPRGTREFGYILLVHPWLVVRELRQAGKIQDGDWHLFLEKHLEHSSSEPGRPRE